MNMVPISRLAKAEEISKLITYLASDEFNMQQDQNLHLMVV